MSEFVSYLQEVFRELGSIKARKMFGGYGLYHNDIMFALIADEQLYLKVDKTIEKYFTSLSLPPFQYTKGDKIVKMSYFLAPDDILEDPEQAAIWGQRSYEVAKRHYKPKKKKAKATV